MSVQRKDVMVAIRGIIGENDNDESIAREDWEAAVASYFDEKAERETRRDEILSIMDEIVDYPFDREVRIGVEIPGENYWEIETTVREAHKTLWFAQNSLER